MIHVSNLVKIFPDRKERVYAVNDVSFTVEDGQFYTLDLESLKGDYQLRAVPGHDHDVLITGLPLADVEATLRKVEMATHPLASDPRSTQST